VFLIAFLAIMYLAKRAVWHRNHPGEKQRTA
jgi:hypothetical protein